jgi:hypothetical protein
MSNTKKNTIQVTVQSDPELKHLDNGTIKLIFTLERSLNPDIFHMYDKRNGTSVNKNIPQKSHTPNKVEPQVKPTVEQPVIQNNLKEGNIVTYYKPSPRGQQYNDLGPFYGKIIGKNNNNTSKYFVENNITKKKILINKSKITKRNSPSPSP